MSKRRRRFFTKEELRRRHARGGFKAAADREVRAFVIKGLKTMTFATLEAACRETFGPDRAPSKSALYRFWIALKVHTNPPGRR